MPSSPGHCCRKMDNDSDQDEELREGIVVQHPHLGLVPPSQ